MKNLMNRILAIALVALTFVSMFEIPTTASAASKSSISITSSSSMTADDDYKLTFTYGGTKPKSYMYAVRDISTDRKIIENTVTTSKSVTIMAKNFTAGHSYRIWVASYDQTKGRGELMAQTTLTLKVKAPKVTAPTIKAPSATVSKSSTSKTTVTASFKISDIGNAKVTKSGIQYGTSKTNLSTTVNNGSVAKSGTYSVSMKNMKPGVYYYRSFATNQAGTTYSDTKNFTVYVCPFCKKYTGDYLDIYTHTLKTKDFKKNAYFSNLYEAGLTCLDLGFDNEIISFIIDWIK